MEARPLEISWVIAGNCLFFVIVLFFWRNQKANLWGAITLCILEHGARNPSLSLTHYHGRGAGLLTNTCEDVRGVCFLPFCIRTGLARDIGCADSIDIYIL